MRFFKTLFTLYIFIIIASLLAGCQEQGPISIVTPLDQAFKNPVDIDFVISKEYSEIECILTHPQLGVVLHMFKNPLEICAEDVCAITLAAPVSGNYQLQISGLEFSGDWERSEYISISFED